jgi:hypothetical protein
MLLDLAGFAVEITLAGTQQEWRWGYPSYCTYSSTAGVQGHPAEGFSAEPRTAA